MTLTLIGGFLCLLGIGLIILAWTIRKEAESLNDRTNITYKESVDLHEEIKKAIEHNQLILNQCKANLQNSEKLLHTIEKYNVST